MTEQGDNYVFVDGKKTYVGYWPEWDSNKWKSPVPYMHVPVGSKWKHLSRGSVYVVVGHAIMQETVDVYDGDPMIVYLPLDVTAEKKHFWVRPFMEFIDGRFERVYD